MNPSRRRFSVAAGTGTAPSADDAIDVRTPRRQDATTSGATAGSRAAFTWRLTPDLSILMDDMALRLKRELGRAKLDRAEMLTALVRLAADNPAVFGALVATLQDNQTS